MIYSPPTLYHKGFMSYNKLLPTMAAALVLVALTEPEHSELRADRCLTVVHQVANLFLAGVVDVVHTEDRPHLCIIYFLDELLRLQQSLCQLPLADVQVAFEYREILFAVVDFLSRLRDSSACPVVLVEYCDYRRARRPHC